MFSRRSPRMNRRNIGVISGSAVSTNPLSPLSLVTSVSVVAYYIGDLGVAEADAAGRASTWSDQSGSAHWVQATALSQPVTALDAAINSRRIVQGTGSPHTMTGGPDRPAPGAATPTFMFCIVRPDTYASGGNLFGSMSLRYGTTANTMRPNCGSNGPEVAITAGTWYRVRATLSNNAGDVFRVGGASGAGSAGNSNPPAMTLFANATPANYGAFSLALALITAGEPSSGELTRLDQFARAYYGSAVQL